MFVAINGSMFVANNILKRNVVPCSATGIQAEKVGSLLPLAPALPAYELAEVGVPLGPALPAYGLADELGMPGVQAKARSASSALWRSHDTRRRKRSRKPAGAAAQRLSTLQASSLTSINGHQPDELDVLLAVHVEQRLAELRAAFQDLPGGAGAARSV